MIYDLPKSVVIDDTEYEIRSDFRAALDICAALSDPELSNEEKAVAALTIFYPAFEREMPPTHYNQAIEEIYRFLNGGELEDNPQKQTRLVDWQQDFPIIVAPVNRVAGKEIRALEYMHWWTFLAYYQEIGGDCTFAQVVSIRYKKSHGKKLDKQEREWYRKNRKIVDFRQNYTDSDKQVFKEWGV